MGKTVEIPANRSEQILGPDDAYEGEDERAGYLIHVTGGDIKIEETLADRSSGARDGVTITDGTTFSLSATPHTAVHAFADGSQVTVEIDGFHRTIGEFD
jgi:hypothetical protein